MEIRLFKPKKSSPQIADEELVVAVQRHERWAEISLFNMLDAYYKLQFPALCPNEADRDDIFQDVYLRIWTEIENKTIKVIDGRMHRLHADGSYAPLTVKLTTFLINGAKNKLHDKYRMAARMATDSIDDEEKGVKMCFGIVDDADETELMEIKYRIVDNCIESLSPNCKEIIKLTVIDKKTLDEVMVLREGRNISKNGLKNAKSKCMVKLEKMIKEEFEKHKLI